ncbi:MBL fold metallo-hydrolase [Paenibacillus sp. NPDC056579]|uniref:MBL fold metallo-hydrolase n=1 Tax=unclassified Paenibacillus TaxID=185978 RepID=UPI001EF804A5|nr:MBL fold metallo-hydrolase [Paenibacillus sp. H1-7]ULL18012.1 MBL fold metallo-hydrolase [Paenibacillus sp. H1-7]
MQIQPQLHLQPEFIEGIKAVILGTGTPRAFYGRAKAGVAVLVRDKTFLVDCGGATVDQLIKSGIMPQRISDVMFTHHHSDHNSGFFDVFITSWRTHVTADQVFEGRKGPMNVYGPTTTKEIIGKMRESFDFDAKLRVNYNKSSGDGADIAYHECNEGVVYERDGIKVTAFEVDHRPVYPAIAYKFEYNGKSLVISGDTIPVASMVEYSKGIDLLVHESYNKAWLDALIEKFPEQTEGLSNPAKYHSTTLEVAEIAREAGVKHLVLTHHIPAPAATDKAEAEYTEGMQEIYGGKITMARDLMSFEL